MKNTENMQDLTNRRFSQRESGLAHPTYDSELAFYELVKSGNVEELAKKRDYDSVDSLARGQLSRDRIRNLRYHIVVTVAMIARFCIEGGLDERESYGLSDVYISRLDETNSEEKLRQIHRELIMDFAGRMKKQNSHKRVSIHIIKVLDYIDSRLHETVLLTDAAAFAGLNRTYLGKLFKKELGVTFSEYVRERKIDAARELLLYSEMTIGQISESLAFASQSHFTEVFRKRTGLTPEKFRNRFYRTHWTGESEG